MNVSAELIGESPGILAVRQKVRKLLDRQPDEQGLPPVLLQGETGTGKGLLAQLLHRLSLRSRAAFVDINCAAIPDTLLEAELFGFERGAFTDARQAKPGLFQAASRGTIFLDEVGLLPERIQAKLLKVIGERTVRRLGSTQNKPTDVWILAASNEDLATAVRQRRFREDLYHRLAVLTIWLPPLRERGTDILLLAEHTSHGPAPNITSSRNTSPPMRERVCSPTNGQATFGSLSTLWNVWRFLRMALRSPQRCSGCEGLR
jgi:transcriptional regulator with PAS, ATPase and Fis domain